MFCFAPYFERNKLTGPAGENTNICYTVVTYCLSQLDSNTSLVSPALI